MSLDLKSYVLPTSPKPDILMVRGEGSFLFDSEGRRYLDFVQGWASNALGHAPKALVQAVSTQASCLWHASPAFYNLPHLDLCASLAQAAEMDHVFLCSTGAEANESAIKLARKWGTIHRQGAYGIITMQDGFHGRTLATMSASGKPSFEPLFEPKVDGFRKVPFGNVPCVAQALDSSIVAILVEPIQGEAGVIVPPLGYLKTLRELASRAGVLLMLDEVQTGMGRTGSLFAFQCEGVVPDVLTVGKGLGSGLPLAAMLCKKEVSCFSPGDQGGTHIGNGLLATIGKTVLDILQSPGFLSGVQTKGEILREALTQFVACYGGQVRGQGLLQAMTLEGPWAATVVDQCRNRGLLLNAPRPDTLRFMPALTVEEAEIEMMSGILGEVLTEVVARSRS